jgi:hypothetical protein
VWLRRMSADSEGSAYTFGSSSCSCSAGTGDGDACGCHDLVGGIVEEFVRPSSVISSPEGNLRSLGSGDGGACLRLSPPWGHRLGLDFAWGLVKEGFWPRLLVKDAADSLAMMMLRVEFGSRLGLG